jgi:catechol 2,3-dioxygenase-like lactoylglutathione lyase family enzyme
MRVLRIAWLGTRTDRATAMAEFLLSTMGLQLDHAGEDTWVFVLPGGGKVEVFGPTDTATDHFTTGPVAGFLVEDVAKATVELRDAGAEILSGPTFAGDDIAWVHFRGPDGNVYELTQGRDLEPIEDVEL